MPERTRHYVLWLINAVQGWDKPTLLGALTSARVNDVDTITAELGDREAPGRLSHGIDVNDHELAKQAPGTAGRTEYTALGALMHEGGHLTRDRLTDKRREGHLFDEYFVPIPVKCLGDHAALGIEVEALRRRLRAPPHPSVDHAALTRVLQGYPEYFGANAVHHVSNYWDQGFSGAPTSAKPDDDTLKEVRMHSRAYLGYYGMLVRWNARAGHEDDRHVLLGYSQGGTVGRFVAHLDEHVFRLGLVHGVITVQSPNYGSPVARAENAEQLELVAGKEVTKLKHLGGLAQWLAPTDVKPLVAWLAKIAAQAPGAEPFTIKGLDEQLASCIVHIRGRVARAEAPSPAASLAVVSMFISARKWISGLHERRNGVTFAFADLNPERISVVHGQHRVLRLINDPTHTTMPHAAITGCNPSLEALFGGGVLGVTARFLAKAAGVSLATLTQQFQTVFDERERLPANPAPEYVQLAEQYRKRIVQIARSTGGPIPPMSHDCVIPSSHQLMYGVAALGDPPASFLGNYVNLDANHASGTALSDARPTDIELVRQALAALPARDR
ncbi:MAG: hypothetical protein IT383_18105 [Deltaproteobacteria bacterium]|nr:hypothetical protein [Deltaproteobacteria bacterium]